MSKASSILRRLERHAARQNVAVLPIKILSYGMDKDGLYHEGDRTYTEEEVTALSAEYQLIVVCYGDGPPGDGETIQMTWGDGEEDERTAAA